MRSKRSTVFNPFATVYISFQYPWDNVFRRLFKYYRYVNHQRIFHWLLSQWYFSARGRIT